jgi:tetratricopeptide (TPR) repeat protein
MNNPFPHNEPTDKELWDELPDASDARKQDIYMTLGVRAFHSEKFDTALAMFEKSLETSENLSLTREKYFSMHWMTRCFRELKEWDKVFDLFARFEEHGLAELEAEDLSHMFRSKAFAHKERRQALEAIVAFQYAENYAREHGDVMSACNDAIQRARIHALLREFSVARDLLIATLTNAREDSIAPVAAMVQLNLGKVYLQSNDFGAAIITLEDAVTTLEAVSDEIHVKDARISLAAAHGRNGDPVRAEAMLVDIESSLEPWDIEERASLALVRAELSWDVDEIAALHKKARAIAQNDGRYHFVNIVDINMAVVMAETGDAVGAERLLRDVIASAEKFDDHDVISEARVRLASILVETSRADAALELLTTISIATFGDDTFAWQRFALVHSTALLLVGNIDEAEQAVTVIMNLDRTFANLPLIAEAYWITSQIEDKRNGRTSVWEHMLSASVAMSLQSGNTELATLRSRDLIPATDSAVTIPRAPIATPSALLEDINEEIA